MLRSNTIDARGLTCPQPVLLTRAALAESDAVLTIVDNATAQHNVTRMAEKAGCTVAAEQRDNGIYLNIRKAEAEVEVKAEAGPLVLVAPGETMGRGDDELGGILIRGFFHALGQTEPRPNTVIFFNSGVKLVVEGSPVLEDLRALCDEGIELLACGTCLGHFGLKDKVAVGEVSNMYTIAETLLRAGKVVYL